MTPDFDLDIATERVQGILRPKPQPAPEPEQKAGGITLSQAQELKDWITLVQTKTAEDCEAGRALESAYSNACYFIDSLAK